MPSDAYPLNDDNIKIRIIKSEDQPKALEFMKTYFFGSDPLTKNSTTKDDEEQLPDSTFLSNIESGSCLMALIKDTDELVGLTITEATDPDEDKYLLEKANDHGDSTLGKIMRFLECVEREANVHKRYNVRKVLHIVATCVASKMRGRNIGARLYNGVAELGKEMGFELLTADCTSYYSAKIKDRLGWDCVHTVYYKDYLGADNKPVFSPPAPHVCCKSYALRL